MKTARILYSIFWIALTLMASPALAQTEAESATLVIESQSGSQSQTLKVGDRINYQPVGGQMQRKGRLEAVGDSSLTIAGKAIAFKDLQAIVHIKGKKKPAGLGLLVGSLIAEPIGLLFFFSRPALPPRQSLRCAKGDHWYFGGAHDFHFPTLDRPRADSACYRLQAV